jgi:hypothetical protein
MAVNVAVMRREKEFASVINGSICRTDPMSILWLTMRTLRSILTDSHLWVPLLVLVAGIALLLQLI